MAAQRQSGGRESRASSAEDGARGVRAAQAYSGLQRERLADLQRARIVGAMLEVCSERGAGSVSVANVVERSGVSRRTFYELFTDREDCSLAAFEQALAYAAQRVIPAYEAQKAWRERIRAGLIALLSFLDEEPTVGRVLLVESLAGGPRTLARRGEVIGKLTSVIEQGACEGRAASTPPPLTGEGVVGAVLAVLQGRLANDAPASFTALANPLMSMIVLPYLGAGAARRELERPVPAVTGPRDGATTLLSDPFKDAGMRLTYRTVRVLTAIAEHPDASNRLIGEAAGIKDQGQVSKLLGRLQRIGMVCNTGLGPGQGAPNAWSLTSSGQQVVNSIRTHTATSHPAGQPGARTGGRR